MVNFDHFDVELEALNADFVPYYLTELTYSFINGANMELNENSICALLGIELSAAVEKVF